MHSGQARYVPCGVMDGPKDLRLVSPIQKPHSGPTVGDVDAPGPCRPSEFQHRLQMWIGEHILVGKGVQGGAAADEATVTILNSGNNQMQGFQKAC